MPCWHSEDVWPKLGAKPRSRVCSKRAPESWSLVSGNKRRAPTHCCLTPYWWCLNTDARWLRQPVMEPSQSCPASCKVLSSVWHSVASFPADGFPYSLAESHVSPPDHHHTLPAQQPSSSNAVSLVIIGDYIIRDVRLKGTRTYCHPGAAQHHWKTAFYFKMASRVLYNSSTCRN